MESCPSFENRFETNHFILRWTNMSDHPEDNISDPALIEEAAGYFETAWEKYTALFHREPYAPPGTGKIEVILIVFQFPYVGNRLPPEGIASVPDEAEIIVARTERIPVRHPPEFVSAGSAEA